MRWFPHVALAIGAGLAAGGCQRPAQPPSKPIERMWERPAMADSEPAPADRPAAPSTAPAHAGGGHDTAAGPRPDEVLAYVNGTAVTRTFIGNELIRTHGLSLTEQMILLIAARQRAQQMSLTVTPADIKAAHEEALRRIAAPQGSADDLSLDRNDAERMLAEFLLAKNIARPEWNRRMEQQAYLRKIAQAEVEATVISEQMLRDEYALEYGERVQIRHIQVSSLEAERKARALLAEKRDFELAARRFSENQVTAVRGGLMSPFTRNDPSITPLIREAAFKMEVGQVSAAIREDGWYHIIRLERRFPASGVGFDNVNRETLRTNLKKRLVAQRMIELEAELFNQARVDIRDRELAEQFNRRRQAAPSSP